MKKVKHKYECRLHLIHDLIGGKWKMPILWHIKEGDNRFSLLEKAIPSISNKVLSAQLKELEAAGLIRKEIVDNRPPKIIVYHLNEPEYPLEEIINLISDFNEIYAERHNIEIKQ